MICEVLPKSPPAAAPATPVAVAAEPSSSPNGGMLALGAVASAAVLFAVSRGGDAPTLATLEKMSTPLEVALANDKPTVLEFYASW